MGAPPDQEIKRNRALAAALAVDDRRRYEIAAAAGIDASHLSRLTSGRQKPTSAVAERLAATLDVAVGQLFPEIATTDDEAAR